MGNGMHHPDEHSFVTSDPRVCSAITHWLPIVTFCPVNGLPDLLYIELVFEDPVPELYSVRRMLRKNFMWRKMFMEDVAKEAATLYPDAAQVIVRLPFNRHVVNLIK